MSDLEFRDNIDVEELAALYAAVGWQHKANLEWLESALDHTSVIIAAYDDDRAVGAVRLATDKSFFAHIIDIVVQPDLQREGIGGELISKVVAMCKGWGFEEKTGELTLFAAQGADHFFQIFNFHLTGNGMYYKFQHLKQARPTTKVKKPSV